jgi:hypothetical protein
MRIYKCLNLSFKTALILQFMNGDECSEREVNLRKSGKSHSLMGHFPIILDLSFYLYRDLLAEKKPFLTKRSKSCDIAPLKGLSHEID